MPVVLVMYFSETNYFIKLPFFFSLWVFVGLNWVVIVLHVLLPGATQMAAFGWSWKVRGGPQAPGPRPRDLHPSVVCVVLPYSLLPGFCGGGSFRSFMVFEVSEHHVHCILLVENSQSQSSSKRRKIGHVCSGIWRIIGGHIWRLSPSFSLCPLCSLYL